jgi:head-tail adaptor
MNASDLNKRIAFKDETGTIVFEKYANVEPTAGRQYVSGLAVNSEVDYVITVRYDKKIDHTLTIIYKDKELEQTEPPINLHEDNIWLKMTCKAVV